MKSKEKEQRKEQKKSIDDQEKHGCQRLENSKMTNQMVRRTCEEKKIIKSKNRGTAGDALSVSELAGQDKNVKLEYLKREKIGQKNCRRYLKKEKSSQETLGPLAT